MSAAHKGHFALDLSTPAHVAGFKKRIYSLLKGDRILDGRPGQVTIFMLDQQRVGVAIIIEVSLARNEQELYTLCVPAKFQGRGYGTIMLDLIMHDMQQVNLYARCSQASQRMQAMLCRRGFKQVSKTADGFNILLRAVPELIASNYQDIYITAVS
ncbi:MAG: GNAT family N-acetyltransferase [Gammaproteobacteria bacterium]|nr:GNAT family N-acetyltransferase [Gammaproteobacteria bacterium]